jgi:hypothetical protein
VLLPTTRMDKHSTVYSVYPTMVLIKFNSPSFYRMVSTGKEVPLSLLATLIISL